MKTEVKFPIYRKYHNGASYFKIFSESLFEEIKKEPGGYRVYEFEARILPDRNFLYDMIYNYQAHWQEIDEGEYLETRSKSKLGR